MSQIRTLFGISITSIAVLLYGCGATPTEKPADQYSGTCIQSPINQLRPGRSSWQIESESRSISMIFKGKSGDNLIFTIDGVDEIFSRHMVPTRRISALGGNSIFSTFSPDNAGLRFPLCQPWIETITLSFAGQYYRDKIKKVTGTPRVISPGVVEIDISLEGEGTVSNCIYDHTLMFFRQCTGSVYNFKTLSFER